MKLFKSYNFASFRGLSAPEPPRLFPKFSKFFLKFSRKFRYNFKKKFATTRKFSVTILKNYTYFIDLQKIFETFRF